MESKQTHLSYPVILRKLYKPDCVEYRKKFNDRMHAYLDRRISQVPSEKAYLHDLSKEKNLIVPNETVLNKLVKPFDIISVSMLKGNSSFLFLEDHTSDISVKEGIGKTAIALKLFGAEIPYEEIPSTSEEILHSGMKRIPFENKQMRLISSDMLFIGINEGSLAVGPMKGEPIISQWDLARHIFRVKDPDYRPGKHREATARNYLESIGATYYLDRGVFADVKKHYPVDNIFLIERKIDNGNDIITKETSSQERLKEIEATLMKNPCYHHSTFWDINKAEHDRRVKAIMKGLDKRKIPEIYKVSIPAYIDKKKEEEMMESISEKILQIL